MGRKERPVELLAAEGRYLPAVTVMTKPDISHRNPCRVNTGIIEYEGVVRVSANHRQAVRLKRHS
jgi:hypothetical protein